MNRENHRSLLQKIAHQAMIDRGLLPDFSPEAIAQLDQIREPEFNLASNISPNIPDMRELLWASIDNDDSRDLDQLTVAGVENSGKVTIYVAIADVDGSVKKATPVDDHARINTTSVYTAAEIFPMLPERLSTDLTSLNFDEDRMAIVVEMMVNEDGTLSDSKIYRAWVQNHAKLAYNSVAAWLEGKAEIPDPIKSVPGLDANLYLQDKVAQRLKRLRESNGALSLETIEAKPIFDGDQIRSLERDERNRAKEIIEDFMIAANGVTARFLEGMKSPSLRRVVRIPKRWDRIVQLAADRNFRLPMEPDSKALEEFLVRQKAADPLRFPDLSLTVIKLLGVGEYVAEQPNGDVPGHFGLAVKDYAHSTAPNRRFPDLITQRLVKAALVNGPFPYSIDELNELAMHCTEMEDAANKVERQVGKSAAALMLESRVGDKFEAIVTGASPKGTWVRMIDELVEGKLIYGYDGVDVGDRLRVRLESVDVENGYIDFRRIN